MYIIISRDRCLRELNDWDCLCANGLVKDNSLLNIENLWKKSIENLTSCDLKQYLEKKIEDWPNILDWKVILECRI